MRSKRVWLPVLLAVPFGLGACVAPDYEVAVSVPPPAALDAYAWLDRSDALLDAIESSPPDFTFDYAGAQLFAWEVDDALIVEEPSEDGYALYIFEDGERRPSFLRTPDFAAGFDRGQLAVIYTRDGQVLTGAAMFDGDFDALALHQRGGEILQSIRYARWDEDAAQAWASIEIVIGNQRRRWSDRWRGDRNWSEYRRRHGGDGRRAALEPERQRRRDAAERFRRWRQGGFTGPAPEGFRRRGGERPGGAGGYGRPDRARGNGAAGSVTTPTGRRPERPRREDGSRPDRLGQGGTRPDATPEDGGTRPGGLRRGEGGTRPPRPPREGATRPDRPQPNDDGSEPGRPVQGDGPPSSERPRQGSGENRPDRPRRSPGTGAQPTAPPAPPQGRPATPPTPPPTPPVATEPQPTSDDAPERQGEREQRIGTARRPRIERPVESGGPLVVPVDRIEDRDARNRAEAARQQEQEAAAQREQEQVRRAAEAQAAREAQEAAAAEARRLQAEQAQREAQAEQARQAEAEAERRRQEDAAQQASEAEAARQREAAADAERQREAAAAAEAARQREAAAAAEAERQREAAEAERQRQAAAAAEAERQRQAAAEAENPQRR